MLPEPSGLHEIEVDRFLTEALGLDGQVDNSEGEPGPTHNFCHHIQVEPDPAAKSEAECWKQDISQEVDLATCGAFDT